MRRRIEPPLPERDGRTRWAYAAAAWTLVFAVRGVYWATGGTTGLSTLSQGIRDAAAADDPWLYAALWVTVALELIAAGIAVTLARGVRRPLAGAALALAGSGAGTTLAAHGALFVGFGLAAVLGGGPVSTEVRWYALLWGPWFLLGGLLFLLAVRSYAVTRRDGLTRLARILGTFGGLATAAAPIVVSTLAGA